VKKQRNRFSRASALQIILFFGLLSSFAILLVIAAPNNTEQARPPSPQLVKGEDADSITALGNYSNTSIPLTTNTIPPTATPTATTPASPTPTATASATPSPCATVPAFTSMSGNVSYCSNPVPAPVPSVTILFNNLPQAITDSSGNYGIHIKFAASGTITPYKAAQTPGSPGISTVDVAAVQRHFLNIGTRLSGCRLTAADVNGDASINTIDVIAIQRFFLGFSTGIANVGNYQFTPPSRCFTAEPNQDFDTLIFGDVATPFIY
jgi:Dockerin type I domain